ncbi:polysulfide reductase NrfD [Fundidesulfovibrio butyratiphilus]
MNQHHANEPYIATPEGARSIVKGLLNPRTFFAFTKEHPLMVLLLVLGAAVAVNRFFIGGLARTTNLDNNNPWGIWISFDLLCGVALAAGGFTTTCGALIFNIKGLRTAVKPAILTAFLGYAFVVFALLFDVGQPWRLPYPVFWSPGTTSVLFEVGLCVMLYVSVLLVEWLPNATDWLGMRKISHAIHKASIPLTVMGVVLSTMHQSSLGALYLIAPGKLHPLWYSSYLPLQFFVSAVVVGMSMVIFEGTISHRFMHDRMSEEYLRDHDGVLFMFAKACSIVLFGYFWIKIIGIISTNSAGHIADAVYGPIWLVEMAGFVVLPCVLYAVGYRNKNTSLIKFTAALTVLGVVFNRFNVSWFAFNVNLPASQRYFPSLQEIIVSVFVVTCIVVCFRFSAKHMAIFSDHPSYDNH